MQRVTFYIDGFNFYNGLKAKMKTDPLWKKYYWIDIVALCEQFIGNGQELIKVKYFTAPPLNSGKQLRQAKLFKANTLLNPDIFKIILGKYYKKKIKCPKCYRTFDKPEEKRTDVNISVAMVGDCALNNTDVIVLISADSDLVPPLEFIQKNFKDKKIKIVFPPKRSSFDLKRFVKRKLIYLENNKGKFEKSVMPNKVEASGKSVAIPNEWKV
jgi:uncharacterized LabA/DUF88 family protein